jgi:putative tricarboxylic transport membrane protein
LTLGIPGSSSAAVLLAALIMYGLRPGRELFTGDPQLIYTIFVALIFAQILFAVIGTFLANPFAKLTIVPSAIVVPTIILSCFMGSFALRGQIEDVLVTAIFGGIGYMMKRAGYPTVPFVLALILGPIAEKNFFRALLISQGSYSIFLASGICIFLGAFFLFALGYPFLEPIKERWKLRVKENLEKQKLL